MRTYATAEPDEVVNVIEVSSTGSIAAGTFKAYSNCSVYVFDGASGSTTARLQHNFPIADIAFSPSDPAVLVTVSDYIRIWNVESGHLLAVLTPHNDTVDSSLCPFTSVAFDPSQNIFCVTDVHGFCSVWDLHKKEPIEVFELGAEKLYDSSFVSTTVIGCVGETGALYVIDRDTHQVVCSQGVQVHPRCQPTKLAWTPGLSLVAVANQTSGVFSIYELTSAGESPVFIGSSKVSTDSIADICWIRSNPQYLVVARDSGSIEVWNRNNLLSPHFDYKGSLPVSALCFNFGSVLIGDTKGQIVTGDLPPRMEEGGVEPFKRARADNRWSDSDNSYPALA